MGHNQDPKSQARSTEYAAGTTFVDPSGYGAFQSMDASTRPGDNSVPYDQDSTDPMVKSSDFAKPPRRCWRRTSGMVYAVKWFLVTVIVSAILSIPMMALTDSVELDSATLDEAIVEAYNKQYKSLGFWISTWILASWLSACLFHALAQIFPYIFRFVSKYINPAHRRYWKVFRFMKWPITILGCTIGSYIAYYFVRMIQWRCVDAYWLTRGR